MNVREIMNTIEKSIEADQLIRSGINKLSGDKIQEALADFEQAIELMPQNNLAKSYEALCRLMLISRSKEIKDVDNAVHLAKASNNLANIITNITNFRNMSKI